MADCQDGASGVRHHFMGRCYWQMRRSTRETRLALCSKDDEIRLSQVREIQDSLGWLSPFDEVFGFAPGFRFLGHEFA